MKFPVLQPYRYLQIRALKQRQGKTKAGIIGVKWSEKRISFILERALVKKQYFDSPSKINHIYIEDTQMTDCPPHVMVIRLDGRLVSYVVILIPETTAALYSVRMDLGI